METYWRCIKECSELLMEKKHKKHSLGRHKTKRKDTVEKDMRLIDGMQR